MVLDLRRVACDPQHSENIFPFSAPPRNRTSSGSFEDCHARPAHPQGLLSKCLDQDLNLDLDLRRVLCDPLHHRDVQHPDLESNQVQGFRKALCDPLHHRDTFRADDWIRTSMERFTRPPPFSIEPRRQAGVQGFEPCGAALEAASSPRRTLLYRPRPCDRGHRRVNYSFSVTFQYASLMNFDQLSIRMLWSA